MVRFLRRIEINQLKIIMNAKKVVIWMLILFSGIACKRNNQVIHRNITGKAGELIVVMSKVAWDDKPGNIVRHFLTQPQVSLPQEEPLFDVTLIPHEAFKDIFMSTRNIIQTRISPIIENPGITFTDDMWAYPQATCQINARNNEEFIKLFTENNLRIIGYFLKAERDRLMKNYDKLHEKAVYNTLENKFDLNLRVYPGFIIKTPAEGFAWIRFETPEISQALLVYTFPYRSDSAFTLNYLIAKRDSFLRLYVPGPTKGSYMTTEKMAKPVLNITRHNGNYAAEVRGLWKVENDFMGGPFIMLAELDAVRQRVVVIDGYVYAPSKNKRNLLRQVEAMVYSLRLKDQEKNDKLNSQMNIGN